MISVVFSTHRTPEQNDEFIKHLKDTSGLKDIQVLMSVNMRQFSLSQIYNMGLDESIHDIVVFVHNDVKLSKNWGRKLLKDFQDIFETLGDKTEENLLKPIHQSIYDTIKKLEKISLEKKIIQKKITY